MSRTEASPPVQLRGNRQTATLALLAFAMLIVSLDQYIVVVALPEIGRELGYSEQTLQSVISAYAVASAGFLLLGGRAADLLGRRRILVAGLALYAVASLAGGLAPTSVFLLMARAAQGLAGALVFPATLSLVNTTFAEGRERNRALAVWGSAGAAGLVVGVLLGGVLTQALGWEAAFFVNVPLAGAAAILAFPLIPADREREVTRSFDLPGAFSATVGVTLLVFALVQGPNLGWSSPPIAASAAASLLMLGALAVIEHRSRDPLVPPRLLANRNLGTAVVIAFLFWATFGSVLYFLTIYLQDVHGYDALETGVGFLVPTAFVVAGSAAAGQLATRFGLRRTMVAALCVGRARCDGARPCHVPGWLLRGVDSRADRAQHRRRRRVHHDVHRGGHRSARWQQGVASGIASTSTSVGAAVGLALLVLVANSGTDGRTGEALRTATADGLSSGGARRRSRDRGHRAGRPEPPSRPDHEPRTPMPPAPGGARPTRP